MARLIFAYGWTRVALISTTDAYGTYQINPQQKKKKKKKKATEEGEIIIDLK